MRFINIVLAMFTVVTLLAGGNVPAAPVLASTTAQTPVSTLSHKVLLPVIGGRARDGRLIYVRSSQDQAAAELWSIDLNGRNDRRILSCPGGCGIESLTASPDGAQIAYVATYRNRPTQLRVVASNGADDRLVLDQAPSTEYTFSPDGRRIVYTQYRPLEPAGEEAALWIIETVSGAPRQLTPWQPFLERAFWLDSEHVLYTQMSAPGTTGTIVRVNVVGTPQPERVFENGTAAALAPDRTTLLVRLETFPMYGPPDEVQFGVFRLDGTWLRLLHRWRAFARARFVWSPDNTRLAQLRTTGLVVFDQAGNATEVKHFPFDGSKESPRPTNQLAWAPDAGSLLYGFSNPTAPNSSEVRRVTLADGSEQTLLGIGQFVVVP